MKTIKLFAIVGVLFLSGCEMSLSIGGNLTDIEEKAIEVFEAGGMTDAKIIGEIPEANRGPLNVLVVEMMGERHDLGGVSWGLVGRNRIVQRGETFRFDVMVSGINKNLDPVAMGFIEGDGAFFFEKNELGRAVHYFDADTGIDVLMVYE